MAMAMASFSFLSLLVFATLLFHSSTVQCRSLVVPSTVADDDELRTYIVHVRPTVTIDGAAGSLEDYYRSFLPTTPEGSAEPDRLFYAYTEVFSGFAARLAEHELDEVARKEGFVRAFPNRMIPLLTTHTPAFLGLQSGSRGGFWNASGFGEGVIIGLLDTGITPGHPSFRDEGMPAPPPKWKGACELQGGCNKKIIGARAYGQSGNDPSDSEGHGTHTAATAAGSVVSDVDAFGLGIGAPTGMAPRAHIAMYKVCNPGAGCGSADILAGLDDAVKDGVDVLSLSLGGYTASYSEDPVAIGTFGATQKGIVVVCAAGNFGPSPGTVLNEAPWVLTVAASSVDRSFRSTVHLGNGKSFDGETLFQPANFTSDQLPLVFPGYNGSAASACKSLDGFDVKGKIVVCLVGGYIAPTEKSEAVKSAGGAGMVLINMQEAGYTVMAAYHAVPTVHVSYADAEEVIAYLHSAKSPTASISFSGTVLGTSPAPAVACFSSRGPSQKSPGVLKPDVSAPGLNILAAWNTKLDGTAEGGFGYNVVSGTSMATPHVSGIAALVRSLHPDWSPAAVKSAILTTSDAADRDGRPIRDEQHLAASFYAKGAGHVNPAGAAEPGLVYDTDADDYVAFLCGLGLGDGGVGAIVRRPNASCAGVRKVTASDLNYPSITVSLGSGPVTVNRTVTNVGAADARYTVEVEAPPEGVTVRVEPEALQFTKGKERITYSVSVSGSAVSFESNLKWVSSSGKVVVRSPLVVD